MWPKAFAQLVELAPHISRLLPMADRFFQSKAAGDEANRKAIDAMGDRLRADLNQINVTHASLSDQIADLSTRTDRLTSDSDTLKRSADLLERRLTKIEAGQRRMAYIAALVLLGIVILVILAVMIYVRGR